MPPSATSSDVTIRCRVRKSIKANGPSFSDKSDMKCILRTGDIGINAWNSPQSIPIVSPCAPELLHPSIFNHPSLNGINSNGSVRIASLYFKPVSSMKAVRHSSLIRKRSTTERNISTIRSQQIEPLDIPPTNNVLLNLPIRSSSPDPTALSATSSSSPYAVEPNSTRRSSVSRSRMSSPDMRLRAASFFAVKASPCSSIEESKESPFIIPICDILLVEFFHPSSTFPSSYIDDAHILITMNSRELYEITFFTIDAMDIMHAFLCAVIPPTRRKVILEEAEMMDENDMHDESFVDDIANFEANAVKDYFRNETYFERMSRRSTRLLQRISDSISGISDCSLNCGSANVQQSPVTKFNGHEYLGNSYYESSQFSTNDKVSLALYLNDKMDMDKASGLELRSSPTLTNSLSSL